MRKPGKPPKQVTEAQREDVNSFGHCRLVIRYLDSFSEEVVCEDYHIEDDRVYLATKTGGQVIPLANIRKLEVIRL